MKVLTLATQKGGSGKSTLASSLLVAAMEQTETRGLDLDPQGTLAAWGARRAGREPKIIRVAGGNLERALADAKADGVGLVVVDTAGVDTAASGLAMRVADFVLIPARPSVPDIEASRPTVAAVLRLNKPFAFVLCQGSPQKSARLSEAAVALGMLGALAGNAIALRADHQDAIAAGMGVTEYSPDGRAAAEIRELWKWIEDRL